MWLTHVDLPEPGSACGTLQVRVFMIRRNTLIRRLANGVRMNLSRGAKGSRLAGVVGLGLVMSRTPAVTQCFRNASRAPVAVRAADPELLLRTPGLGMRRRLPLVPSPSLEPGW